MSVARARVVLGVTKKAGPGEVRKAWRRLVMRHHPDRDGGSEEKTREINAAYEALKAHEVHARPIFEAEAGEAPEPEKAAEPEPKPQTEPKPEPDPARRWQKPKPKVRPKATSDRRSEPRTYGTKKTAFPEAALAEFKERLAREDQRRVFEDAVKRNGGFYPDPRQCAPGTREAGEAADHVPGEIRISGRQVFFTVPTPLDSGSNRVALPTGRAGGQPAVLKFTTRQPGQGKVVLPSAALAAHFPWADRVEIEFQGG